MIKRLYSEIYGLNVEPDGPLSSQNKSRLQDLAKGFLWGVEGGIAGVDYFVNSLYGFENREIL